MRIDKRMDHQQNFSHEQHADVYKRFFGKKRSL